MQVFLMKWIIPLPAAIKRFVVIFGSTNVIIGHFGYLLSPAAERLKFLQKFKIKLFPHPSLML